MIIADSSDKADSNYVRGRQLLPLNHFTDNNKSNNSASGPKIALFFIRCACI